MGLFGGGNSSSSNQTTNNDRRIVNGAGGFVVGDGSVLSMSDQGSIKAAFDFATNANATNGEGFNKLLSTQDAGLNRLVNAQSNGFGQLLDTTAGLFKTQSDAATKMAGQTEQAVLDAYRNASSDATGTIDNRTIIVLALAGLAAVFFMMRKG